MSLMIWFARVASACALTLAIVVMHGWAVGTPTFGPAGPVFPGWPEHLAAFGAIALLGGGGGWLLGWGFDALDARAVGFSRKLVGVLGFLFGTGKVTLGLALVAMAATILRDPDWRGVAAVFLVTLVGVGRAMGVTLPTPGLVDLVPEE